METEKTTKNTSTINIIIPIELTIIVVVAIVVADVVEFLIVKRAGYSTQS